MILLQTTDEERAEDAPIPALHTAVELHASEEGFVVADDGYRVLIGVDGGNQAAYHILHRF